jgi:hypothetical protein
VKRNNGAYLLMVLCLALTACTGSFFRNYGRINSSRPVTEAFERHEVNPDLRYYTSGSDLYPNALMGLRREYRLDPETLWKEVEMTPERMKEIVEHMKTAAADLMQFQYGFDIRDNGGRPIGVWYSILEVRTVVRMNEDGTVRIDTPDLDTYKKLSRDPDNGGGSK